MISRYRMALMQVVDLCCILLALAVSGMVTIAPDLSVFDDYTGASLFTIFFYLLFFYILDAYSVGMEDFKDTLGRILVACVLGIISSATASFALENWRFDRVTVLLLFALSFVFCLGWRFLYYLNADKLTHPLRVLLVGVDRGGKVRKLLAEGLPKARILGYVGEKDQDPDAGECFGPPFMALEAAKKHGATMIVLLPDAPIDDDIAHDLLEAKLHGAMVVDIRTFYEHVVQRLPLSQITEEWLLQTEGFSLNTRGSLRRLKRAFDLFLSLMLLIPAAPIMLITALLIRLESPGPVIYRQDRVGLYEKEFTVYKFRSMRTDAEKNGAVWAAANDARVTRVGKFIRKVRIDELPQIWNIIKGDMSFIGPRPERMTFVKQLKEHIPYYSLRHTVKPGLTGWAQVCYPYGANEEDARHKLEYDLFYVKNISILLDIHIIFKTVGVVLFPKGARYGADQPADPPRFFLPVRMQRGPKTALRGSGMLLPRALLPCLTVLAVLAVDEALQDAAVPFPAAVAFVVQGFKMRPEVLKIPYLLLHRFDMRADEPVDPVAAARGMVAVHQQGADLVQAHAVPAAMPDEAQPRDVLVPVKTIVPFRAFRAFQQPFLLVIADGDHLTAGHLRQLAYLHFHARPPVRACPGRKGSCGKNFSQRFLPS